MNDSQHERFRRIDAIFDGALDLPEDEQVAFIERACGDDADIRANVLELLAAHRNSHGFLDAPVARIGDLLEDGEGEADAIPESIGPFKVVRSLGQGGMGQVFLGVRADGQFEQRVALKLLRHATPTLVRRFLEERRILALLEHPGIARLIDGGITSHGLPYLALEYVDGEPIDLYCDTHALSLEQRIALFGDVCNAVAYAHQHLIIHRDLKPSNILVTPDGQAKLLDFGIAKLLGGDGVSVEETRTEFRAMTPESAAPEQVRGRAISTATDVYSLGVLLYRLLSGERPYDLRGKTFAEMEQIVCEHEPPLPSTRAPSTRRRRMRGDLDLIVMTALQKEESRRYQSPAALADDLHRFLHGHAIVARPDSVRYRLGKFVGRHRAGVAVAAIFALTLVGGASRERVLRHRAEMAARKATAVETFLQGVFDVSDPFAGHEPDGGTITARELLDRGAGRIDSTLVDQPEVQAELRSVLGRVYTNLGLFDRATPLLERSLKQRRALYGEVHASVASDMNVLGATLMQQDRYDEAEPMLRSALDQRRRLLGNSNAATAETIEHLATLFERRNDYDAAEPLHREALAIRRAVFGDTDVAVATSLNNLGLIRYRKGAYAEAESLYRQALDIDVRLRGEAHPITAQAMQNLAQTLHLQGDLAGAEALHRRALAAKRKSLGNAHPSVTISLNNLGGLLARDLDRLDEGEQLTREALALDRQIFGDRHSYVAQSMANLGVILRMKGEFAESERLLRGALDINRGLFGERHSAVANNYGQLAMVRYQLSDDVAAVRLARESLSQYRDLLGDKHINSVITRGILARLLVETGKPGEGESLARESLEQLDPASARQLPQVIAVKRTLGAAILAQGRTDEALPLLAAALEQSRRRYGDADWRTADVKLAYGSALLAKGRYADAVLLLRAADATLRGHRRAQPRLAVMAAAAVARAERTRRPHVAPDIRQEPPTGSQ